MKKWLVKIDNESFSFMQDLSIFNINGVLARHKVNKLIVDLFEVESTDRKFFTRHKTAG